jgi:hypothetical protein
LNKCMKCISARTSQQGFPYIDCNIAHTLAHSSTLIALRKDYSNLPRLSQCVAPHWLKVGQLKP